MINDFPDDAPTFDLAVPLNTDADLLGRIDSVVGQDLRRRRSLWVLFLSGDGAQLPVVVPIDDVPERPDPELVGSLFGIIASVLQDAAPDGSAAFALTRPGSGIMCDSDRYWVRSLHDAAAEFHAPIRLICLATAGGVRQLALDDAL